MMIPMVLVLLLVALAGLQLRFVLQRRRHAKLDLDTLLARLEAVDIANLRAVADCYLQPDARQLRYEPNVMWAMVGGLPGTNRLLRNAEVMLDLALYAERWNDENGRAIAEMMRRDAMRLNKAITAVQAAVFTSCGLVRAPFHLQEAIASYCLMRARLLGLYAGCHMTGLLPSLEGAV